MLKIIATSIIASFFLLGCSSKAPEPTTQEIVYESFEYASVQYSTKVLIDGKHQTLMKGETPQKGIVELYRTEIFLKNSRTTKSVFLSEKLEEGTVLEYILKNDIFTNLQIAKNK
ncbi:MAG: hypothetical protein PHZ26_06065 [Candidatus Gracilibacteria bacterium]|nr:hypothetical protein [Candidatus Gracilibacteria bacterium]